MLDNVQRKTIEPIIRQSVSEDSILYTDEYNIYTWSSDFFQHKTVNHSLGEYARDEDGDGHFEPGRRCGACEHDGMLLPGRRCGACYGPGSGFIGVSPKRICPTIWAFLSACIT